MKNNNFLNDFAKLIADNLKTYLVQEIEPPQSAPKDELKYLSRSETAQFLNISKPTLTKICKQGILSPIRIGRRLLFKLSDIENNLQNLKPIKL